MGERIDGAVVARADPDADGRGTGHHQEASNAAAAPAACLNGARAGLRGG